MNLRIVDTKKVETFDVAYIECFTSEGNITILPGHEPAIVALKAGSPIIMHYTSGVVEEKTTCNALLDIERDALVCIEE